MVSGTIRFTTTKDKGYFFIHVDGQRDVFCHVKNTFLNDEDIVTGTRVKFELRPSPRDGKIQAYDVVLEKEKEPVDEQAFVSGKVDGQGGNV